MTQDQIRAFHESIVVSQLFSPQRFSIDMDNIVSGKRRRMVTAQSELVMGSPRTSQSPRARNESSAGKGEF